MRKHITTIVLLLALVLSASAQQYHVKPFSSLSFGVSAGTDGLGIGAATELSSHLMLRGAFTMIPGIGGTKTLNIDSDRFWDIHGETGFHWKLSTRDLSIMLDYAPFIGVPFRVTAGFYSTFIVYNGTLQSDEIPVDINSRKVALDEERSVSLNVYNRFIAETLVNATKPYIGIGWGTPIAYGGRVSLTVDAGAMYLGSSKVQTYDFYPEGISADVPCFVTSADFEGLDGGAFDKWTGLKFWPVVKVGVNFRVY